MIIKLLILISAMLPRLRGGLWKTWYEFISDYYQHEDWTFMNYGYAELNSLHCLLPLQDADEPDRYSIQLYHHLVGPVDLRHSVVLEVGSGRGGGCSYLTRYLQAASVFGLDCSRSAVAFCRHAHQLPSMTFRHGDAEAMPFSDNSFDVIINVESSHCYPSMERFLKEVFRVLKPGGHFLWADFRVPNGVNLVKQQFETAGLMLIQEEDITPNVIKAMDLVAEHKVKLIQNHVPRILAYYFADFAGLPGTRVYEEFRARNAIYLCCALRKAEA